MRVKDSLPLWAIAVLIIYVLVAVLYLVEWTR